MATLAPLEGIHHLTAISADAQRTIDFYSTLLGQRLVKQTVNFDDPASHHLYFADEEHGPGAITFFAWPGAPRGNYGIGGTHHDDVDPTAPVAAEQAEGDSDTGRYGDGEDGHLEGDAGAKDLPAKHVAAEAVGAERMAPTR